MNKYCSNDLLAPLQYLQSTLDVESSLLVKYPLENQKRLVFHHQLTKQGEGNQNFRNLLSNRVLDKTNVARLFISMKLQQNLT